MSLPTTPGMDRHGRNLYTDMLRGVSMLNQMLRRRFARQGPETTDRTGTLPDAVA